MYFFRIRRNIVKGVETGKGGENLPKGYGIWRLVRNINNFFNYVNNTPSQPLYIVVWLEKLQKIIFTVLRLI